MIVYGIDPGFAAMGVARVELDATTERVVSFHVLRTEKDKRKTARASDDNLRRAQSLAEQLDDVIRDLVFTDRVAICAETQSWPRNAGAVAKVGMAWGVLAAVAMDWKLPIVQATPMEIKRAVCGKKTATKEEVQAALEQRYPAMPHWPKQKTLVEHAADALGAVVACLDHETIRAVRNVLQAGTVKVCHG